MGIRWVCIWVINASSRGGYWTVKAISLQCASLDCSVYESESLECSAEALGSLVTCLHPTRRSPPCFVACMLSQQSSSNISVWPKSHTRLKRCQAGNVVFSNRWA
jgi:hypothetical protein